MQASPYFAGARPQQHDGVALARLTRRKRARIAPSRDEDKPQEKLTAMEQQVVTLRRRHPDLLLLFECGYRMRMFADDAQVIESCTNMASPEPALAVTKRCLLCSMQRLCWASACSGTATFCKRLCRLCAQCTTRGVSYAQASKSAS